MSKRNQTKIQKRQQFANNILQIKPKLLF